MTAANAWDTAQNTWLESTLAVPTTYTFVVRHEASDATPPLPPGVAGVDALLAKYPYTLLIVGHTHDYGHYSDAPQVLVIGNGGAPLSSSSYDYGYGLLSQRCDGAIASVRITGGDAELPGPILDPGTWARASGKVEVAADEWNLRCLRRLVPFGLPDVRGRLTTRATVERAPGARLPSVRAASASNSSVTKRRDRPRSSKPTRAKSANRRRARMPQEKSRPPRSAPAGNASVSSVRKKPCAKKPLRWSARAASRRRPR